MSSQPTTIERAYELARSGTCTNITDIEKALKREGFSSVEAHLHGSSIRSGLRQLCAEARKRRGSPAEDAAPADG